MDAGTFDNYINSELDRLHGERNELLGRRNELDEKLTGIERELTAIEAYRTTRNGGGLVAIHGRSGQQPQRTRIRRGSRREAILNLVRQNPDGVRRGDILEKMGLKGDKSGEMSVSNALTAMVKKNQVSREGGKYKAL